MSRRLFLRACIGTNAGVGARTQDQRAARAKRMPLERNLLENLDRKLRLSALRWPLQQILLPRPSNNNGASFGEHCPLVRLKSSIARPAIAKMGLLRCFVNKNCLLDALETFQNDGLLRNNNNAS